MTVAETPAIRKAAPPTQASLGVLSLLGGVLALLGIWFVLGALPVLWTETLGIGPPNVNDFLSGALLLIVSIALIVLLGYWGYNALEKFHIPGLRAGIFFAATFIFVTLWIGFSFANWMESRQMEGVGGTLAFVIVGGLLAAILWSFNRPGFGEWLRGMEGQGWFQFGSYKGSQGVRVRRCTVVAVLVIGICGIITLISHRSLGSDRYGPNDWYWKVPFTSQDISSEPAVGNTPASAGYEQYLYIPILHKVHMIVPVLLLIGVIWIAYRLVNLPTFADFLVATEAEMNKVSWTTRRRLVQDTIVVLVTVALFTVFLFVTDIVWIKLLSLQPIPGVLQVDLKQEVQKQQEKTQW